MYSLQLLTAFLTTTFIFAFIPGPAMFYAAAQTLAGGRRAGLMAAFGIHIGGYVHIAAASVGLTMLFHAIPTLYLIVKALGAAYLVWLGVSLFLSAKRPKEVSLEIEKKSASKAFAQSVAVEALNPKTAIFFTAFLPQFVDFNIQVPMSLQIFVLGALVNLIFTFADILCVLLAGILINAVRNSGRLQRNLQRAGGTILVGLGTHLLLQRA